MPKKGNPLAVASKAIDPTLNALFATSAGPVKAPPKSRYAESVERKPAKTNGRDQDRDHGEDEGDDEVLSEISEELDYGDEDEEDNENDSGTSEQDGDEDDDEEDAEGDNDNEDVMSVTKDLASEEKQQAEDAVATTGVAVEAERTKRDRKRKRKDENEDLEGKYLAKLAKEEESEPSVKRQKGDEEKEDDENAEDDDEEVPVHETLTQENTKSEVEKASRTVFLANVSTEAISSKSAKKELMKHLSSILDQDASPPQKIESLRFRSVAFSAGAMPKRAAYITKSLMDATTKSTNAYVVYSTAATARKAAAELNGSEILGRHIRVDSVAHPSPTDNRRCVFVGNLGFVDDETILSTKGDGETIQKKRNKTPSDVEEGLWRTFGAQGKVENVRVVRDPKTRVGKGFAYVQFYDANDVESALLLDGKKFPPMLPRALRVTRAKDPRKTAQALERARAKADAANGTGRSMKYKPKATPEEQAAAGRASKLLGRAGAAKQRNGAKGHFSKDGEAPSGLKTPEAIIFEGRRASAKDGLPKDLKLGKKSKGKAGKSAKPKHRSARRAAVWKQKKK